MNKPISESHEPPKGGEENEPPRKARRRRRTPWIAAFLSRFKTLLNPQTWLKPKTIPLLVVAWVIYQLGALGIKRIELTIEDRFKSSGISVEYGRIESLGSSDLDQYAERVGCGTFERNLDDDVITNYFVIPLKFQNFTRSPVGRVEFVLDAGCPYAKIIDVRYAVLSPKGKRMVIRHDLPELKWTPLTNLVAVKASWEFQRGDRAIVYGSVAKDRGFGQVTPVPDEGDTVWLAFVPSRKPSRYFFRVTMVNAWGEGEPGKVMAVPTARYLLANFKPLKESATNDSQTPVLGAKESMPFLEGRATISFETGLDPEATVAVYVLGKITPGESINPSVKMYGEPGVLFREENPTPRFAILETESLSQAKLNTTPLQVRSVSVSDKLLFFWDASTCSNYSGVKVFRSNVRPLGDFTNIGEKIFDGFGSTNSFEIERISEVNRPKPSSGEAPNYQEFLEHAPVDPQPAPNARTHPPPDAPTNLRWHISEKVEGFAFFTDAPPERDVVFTYTLYAFDRAGNQSYPVVINAMLDSGATNCIFRLVK
jgi:hypothetical protein